MRLYVYIKLSQWVLQDAIFRYMKTFITFFLSINTIIILVITKCWSQIWKWISTSAVLLISDIEVCYYFAYTFFTLFRPLLQTYFKIICYIYSNSLCHCIKINNLFSNWSNQNQLHYIFVMEMSVVRQDKTSAKLQWVN